MPGLRLLVAGPGNPGRGHGGVAAGRAWPREFLGAVPDEDKASLLASVDLYVAPNTGGESFGIILIEAMSAGACVSPATCPPSPGYSTAAPRVRCSATRTPDLARQLVDLLG